MTWVESAVLVVAGVGAGAINTVVGSGTLVTFPVLLWARLPPVAANVANNVGLAPGSLSGAVGYRKEHSGSAKRAFRYGAAAVAGGVAGALLLVASPPGLFRVVAPVLIGIALVLVVAEPRLARRLEFWQDDGSAGGSRVVAAAVFVTSVYGGYFGAGHGVILFSALAVLMAEPLQQVNALKNVLQAVDNAASALLFALVAHVEWSAVGLLALGAAAGGWWGRRSGVACRSPSCAGSSSS